MFSVLCNAVVVPLAVRAVSSQLLLICTNVLEQSFPRLYVLYIQEVVVEFVHEDFGTILSKTFHSLYDTIQILRRDHDHTHKMQITQAIERICYRVPTILRQKKKKS